ncbi:MAG: sigma-70 family RNA polymerase sigma factor [Oscillospiraceae bacterium]|nr:sigma-70 family RNA polymerase sigma factor [Oscillospiraceae bacterium]
MRDGTDVMKMFSAYVRISLKNCSLNYIRKERRRKAHEILISNLDGKYYTMQDDFPTQNNILQIMDSAICIRQDMLYDALRKMEKRRREVAYMSFGLGMSDQKIAETMQIPRSTVQRIKKQALEELREKMKEGMEKPP